MSGSAQRSIRSPILVNERNLVAVGVDIRDHLALGSSRFTCLNWIDALVANDDSTKFSTSRPQRISSFIEEFSELRSGNVDDLSGWIDWHG